MDRDTIRRGGAVGSTVGGGGALTGDGGRELSRRDGHRATGPRLIGLHSRAHRLERVRAGQGTCPNYPAPVGVTRDRAGDLVPPASRRYEHNTARPDLHGTSRGTISECCTLESNLWHRHTKRQNRRVRRRVCVTLLRDIFARRPRSTSLLFSQHAVSPSVTEIDGKPDREPDEEPHPRVQRKRQHEAETGEDAEHWHERYERGAERSLEIGSRMSQDPYAGAHEHEREQRADVDPRPQQLQRQQPGCEAYRDAGVDRGEVRRG